MARKSEAGFVENGNKKTLLQKAAGLEIRRLKRSLSLLSKRCESSLVVDSQIREHLAVQVDASLLQAVHEAAVVHVAGLSSSRKYG